MAELERLSRQAIDPQEGSIARAFLRQGPSLGFAVSAARAGVGDANAGQQSLRVRLEQAIVECTYALAQQQPGSLAVVSNNRPLVGRHWVSLTSVPSPWPSSTGGCASRSNPKRWSWLYGGCQGPPSCYSVAPLPNFCKTTLPASRGIPTCPEQISSWLGPPKRPGAAVGLDLFLSIRVVGLARAGSGGERRDLAAAAPVLAPLAAGSLAALPAAAQTGVC